MAYVPGPGAYNKRPEFGPGSERNRAHSLQPRRFDVKFYTQNYQSPGFG